MLGILLLGFALNLVQAFLVNGALVKLVAKVPALTFFKAVLPAQTTAFTTQSSVATLPLSIRQIGTIGVGADIANFTTPIGTTIGMPGCAGVWPMLSAVFTINALGLDYGPGEYVALAVIGLFASIGTAGVPGTAIVTATTVFTAVGLPVQLLVPLVPVSNIVGMPSTMANVSAAVTCATIVARQTGELDDDVLAGARARAHSRAHSRSRARSRSATAPAGVPVGLAGVAAAASTAGVGAVRPSAADAAIGKVRGGRHRADTVSQPVLAPVATPVAAASGASVVASSGVPSLSAPVASPLAHPLAGGVSSIPRASLLHLGSDGDDRPVPVGACGVASTVAA